MMMGRRNAGDLSAGSAKTNVIGWLVAAAILGVCLVMCLGCGKSEYDKKKPAPKTAEVKAENNTLLTECLMALASRQRDDATRLAYLEARDNAQALVNKCSIEHAREMDARVKKLEGMVVYSSSPHPEAGPTPRQAAIETVIPPLSLPVTPKEGD